MPFSDALSENELNSTGNFNLKETVGAAHGLFTTGKNHSKMLMMKYSNFACKQHSSVVSGFFPGMPSLKRA